MGIQEIEGNRLVGLDYVTGAVGRSKQWVYRYMKRGVFPLQIRRGQWVQAEVDNYVSMQNESLAKDINERVLKHEWK